MVMLVDSDNANARTTELMFPVDGRTPLFMSELKIYEGSVVLEPDADDVLAVFMTAIDRLVYNLRSVTSIDRDVMSLIQLEPKVLLNIGQGNPLLADLDSIIKRTREGIASAVSRAMQVIHDFLLLTYEICIFLNYFFYLHMKFAFFNYSLLFTYEICSTRFNS